MLSSIRSKAIIFFGPDGAGKTTQANLLTKTLISNGIRVRRCWIRSLHSIAYLISSLLSIPLGLDDPRYFRSRYRRNPMFRRLWNFIEFISIAPLILTRMRIPLVLGYTVVAERFVIDSVVSLAYFLNTSDFCSGRISGILFGLVPRDAKLIYLDCDYETIIARREVDIEERSFIEFQRKWYSFFANRFQADVYDTARISPQEIFQKISLAAFTSNSV